MLLKEVRETYERYLTEPFADPMFRHLTAADLESRYQRNSGMRKLAFDAQSFVLEDNARDLVATMNMRMQTRDDLNALLCEAPLPFPTTWIEYDQELEGENLPYARYRVGILLKKTGSKVLAFCFHKIAGHRLVEPSVFAAAEPGNKLEVSLDPHIYPTLAEGLEGSEERLEELGLRSLSELAWALAVAVEALHLIAARGGPLDRVQESLLSRPERRRLERDGVLAKGSAPTVTHIRLNEQGRLHLQAVDDEEGGQGGARRRAHRVRGHIMRTTRGDVWRKAHIRGFGPVNETARFVSVASENPSIPIK